MVWYRFDKKRTTDDLLRLSVSWLKKHNCLQENAIINGGLTWKRTCGGGCVRKTASVIYTTNFIGEKRSLTLTYTFNGKENLSYDVPIVYSSPYYGGKRYWFVCPRCGRKTAFLYGGKYFWCRQCQNLSYPTQQMGLVSRMLEKSRKFQDKVLIDGCRKRWLHRTTLEKYLDKSEDYEMRGMMALYKTFKKFV